MLEVTHRDDDLVVAALPEDVDLFAAESMRAEIDRLLGQGCRRLVLDASRTAYLDSTGVSLMLSWRRRLEERQGALVLAGPNEHLRRMMWILGLEEILPAYATVLEAQARVGRGPSQRPAAEGTSDTQDLEGASEA
ncbi:STAS domain-containing protein [Streptomyces longwoodensis]|uniref:STAS domain-containing protein n=1 Tax=Streptomyces longwoodensis TaxID=68231 RepID=UPI0033EAB9E6